MNLQLKHITISIRTIRKLYLKTHTMHQQHKRYSSTSKHHNKLQNYRHRLLKFLYLPFQTNWQQHIKILWSFINTNIPLYYLMLSVSQKCDNKKKKKTCISVKIFKVTFSSWVQGVVERCIEEENKTITIIS